MFFIGNLVEHVYQKQQQYYRFEMMRPQNCNTSTLNRNINHRDFLSIIVVENTIVYSLRKYKMVAIVRDKTNTKINLLPLFEKYIL